MSVRSPQWWNILMLSIDPSTFCDTAVDTYSEGTQLAALPTAQGRAAYMKQQGDSQKRERASGNFHPRGF